MPPLTWLPIPPALRDWRGEDIAADVDALLIPVGPRAVLRADFGPRRLRLLARIGGGRLLELEECELTASRLFAATRGERPGVRG